jgi:hypothetical protein
MHVYLNGTLIKTLGRQTDPPDPTPKDHPPHQTGRIRWNTSTDHKPEQINRLLTRDRCHAVSVYLAGANVARGRRPLPIRGANPGGVTRYVGVGYGVGRGSGGAGLRRQDRNGVLVAGHDM